MTSHEHHIISNNWHLTWCLTGGFPAQRASNADSIFTSRLHHVCGMFVTIIPQQGIHYIPCIWHDVAEPGQNRPNAANMRLTHWGQVTHICVGNLTIIGPGNGLSPGRRQAIIWTNAGILLIGPWGTNFSEISMGIQRFSFKKMHLTMSSAKWRPFCLIPIQPYYSMFTM